MAPIFTGSRFGFSKPILATTIQYETLTFTNPDAALTITNNGTTSVDIYRSVGSNSWNTQAYVSAGFIAPVTMEFNKDAAASDNGVSYAMISWNADPTTNASYTSLDHASYPYQTSGYQVYSNGSLVLNSATAWSTANKFYLVYGTDGFIRHYNGSTQLYSVNYGTGNTVYVDSSFYSASATWARFYNIRVIRQTWNGTAYV